MAGVSARVWFALGIVYVVWGSTYLAIRWTVETMPPFLSAGMRFVVAGMLLAAYLRVRRARGGTSRSGARDHPGSGGGRPQARPASDRVRLRNAALCGVLVLASGNGLVVFAETRVPSGLAALLVAAVPLWLVVLRRVAGDRTPALTLLGVLVGLAGVAVLLLPGSRGGHVQVLYCLVVLLAALSWSAGSLLAVRLPVPDEPARLSSIEMLAGGVVLLAAAAARGEFTRFDLSTVSAKSWLSLGYLIVFGSLVAFSAYVWVFANAPTSLVATYAYVNPAVAVLLGAGLAGERLTPVEALGGLVILGSVVLVVTAESRASPPRCAPATNRGDSSTGTGLAGDPSPDRSEEAA